MMTASKPTKKSPFINGGSKLSARRGYASNGFISLSVAAAYNPVVTVRKSKINQNRMEISIPFFAICTVFAAEQR